MDEFWKSVGQWATTQTFERVIILVVVVLVFIYGHEWLKVILEHRRESRKINNDEQRRKEQTAREIKEKMERRKQRAKRIERDRREK